MRKPKKIPRHKQNNPISNKRSNRTNHLPKTTKRIPPKITNRHPIRTTPSKKFKPVSTMQTTKPFNRNNITIPTNLNHPILPARIKNNIFRKQRLHLQNPFHAKLIRPCPWEPEDVRQPGKSAYSQ